MDVWLIKTTDDAGSGAPFITRPADVTYEEGNTGNSITWNPRDGNPHKYNVTMDDTLVPGKSGDWDGGDIVVDVDDLSVGTYIFTCSVNDTWGNSVSDSVTVTEPVSEFLGVTAFLALAVIGIAVVLRVVLAKQKH